MNLLPPAAKARRCDEKSACPIEQALFEGGERESEFEEPGGDIAGLAVHLDLRPIGRLFQHLDRRADRNRADHVRGEARAAAEIDVAAAVGVEHARRAVVHVGRDLQVLGHHVAGLAVHADLVPVALTRQQRHGLAVAIVPQRFAAHVGLAAQEEHLRVARVVDHGRADSRRDGGGAAADGLAGEPAALHIADLAIHADLAPFAGGGEHGHLRAARIRAEDVAVRLGAQVQAAVVRLDIRGGVGRALAPQILGIHIAALTADVHADGEDRRVRIFDALRHVPCTDCRFVGIAGAIRRRFVQHMVIEDFPGRIIGVIAAIAAANIRGWEAV